MRTNIDIDDELLNKAQAITGCKTKKATVEEALRLLVRRELLRQLDEMRGPDMFEPDYDYKAMRMAD